MMRGDKVLELPMEIEPFESKPVYEIEFGILQCKTRDKDRNRMPPEI